MIVLMLWKKGKNMCTMYYTNGIVCSILFFKSYFLPIEDGEMFFKDNSTFVNNSISHGILNDLSRTTNKI